LDGNLLREIPEGVGYARVDVNVLRTGYLVVWEQREEEEIMGFGDPMDRK
jgi:hypothetical protein